MTIEPTQPIGLLGLLSRSLWPGSRRAASAGSSGKQCRRSSGLARSSSTPDQQWYRRLELTGNYEIWLLSWLPGQHTGLHDHGGACGAYEVVRGELRETLARPGRHWLRGRTAGAGTVTTFGAGHVHDVGNESGAPAISVHAYAPPLTAMRRYGMTPSGLSLVRTDVAEQDW